MSKEFKVITAAPFYEMNEEGTVRKIKSGSVIFPSPLGSDTINLFVDVDNKKQFAISELLFELFAIKRELVEVEEESKPKVKEMIQEAKSGNVESLPELPKAKKVKEAKEEKPVKVAKVKAEKPVKVKKEKVVKVKRAKGGALTFTTTNAKEKKIMDLDCKLSIKMWKLSQLGLTVDEIRAIIPYPENWPTAGTIAKYKTNETLRNRADAIK